MEPEEVRVLRIIEYRGPRHWVETTVRRSIHGTKVLENGAFITVTTLGEYPELVHPSDPSPRPTPDGLDKVRQVLNELERLVDLKPNGGISKAVDLYYLKGDLHAALRQLEER